MNCKSCFWLNDGSCMMGLDNWRYNTPKETVCEWYKSEETKQKKQNK